MRLPPTLFRRVLAAVVALVALVGIARPAGATPGDAGWILSDVRPDGAIATNPDQRLVWPYVANFAAMGLAGSAATDPAAAEAGWRWLEWYQAHQDVNGFVTDYELHAGGLVSTHTMDSTDAYAGTYLLAASKLVDATGDLARLVGLRSGVSAAVHAIEATQDGDGLTWAKPAWKVKYLMDQAETYAGLRAASHLADLLGDQALGARADSDAQHLRSGVLALWNPSTGAYDWAVHEGGGHHRADWSVLYPDAMQEVWAVAFGLDGGAHASEIMDRFLQSQPDWSNPSATARFDSGRAKIGYWPIAAWALKAVGRESSVAAARIRLATEADGRAWPFTSAIAGQLALLDAPGLPVTPLGPAGASTTPTTVAPPTTSTTATTAAPPPASPTATAPWWASGPGRHRVNRRRLRSAAASIGASRPPLADRADQVLAVAALAVVAFWWSRRSRSHAVASPTPATDTRQPGTSG